MSEFLFPLAITFLLTGIYVELGRIRRRLISHTKDSEALNGETK